MEGEAVELVRFDADASRFELGARALDVLRATHGPVAVVAVCGRARQVRRCGWCMELPPSGMQSAGPRRSAGLAVDASAAAGCSPTRACAQKPRASPSS